MGLDTKEGLELVNAIYTTTVPEILDTLKQYGIESKDIKQTLDILVGSDEVGPLSTSYSFYKNIDNTVRFLGYTDVTDALNAGVSDVINTAQNINSNTGNVAEKIKTTIPLQATIAGAGTAIKAGATSALTGLTATTVVNPVSASIAAVGAGIALGTVFDAALYNLNPDFFDAHGMSTLNPETWKSLVDINDMFPTIFKTDASVGTSQMYLDENAFAYLAQFLNNKGAFDSGEKQTVVSMPENADDWEKENLKGIPDITLSDNVNYSSTNDTLYSYTSQESEPSYSYAGMINTYFTYGLIIASTSKNSFNYSAIEGNTTSNKTTAATKHVLNNKTFYSNDASSLINTSNPITGGVPFTPSSYNASNKLSFKDIQSLGLGDLLTGWALFAYKILFGKKTTTGGGIEGITKQDGGTTPNINKDDSLDEVLRKLKEQYKKLWDNALTVDTPQPDGTVKHYTYVPVGTPLANGLTDTQPTSGEQTQENTEVSTKTSPSDLVKTIIDYITNTPTDTDKNNNNTGTGTTPPFVPVTGEASALYSIYNPTLAQINSLGSWLWSSNFIDQLLKLFSSPMDAIIGLHKIYATPSTGGTQNIKVGYLDSGVSSKIVSNQYTTIDCGTVNCFEQFGNILDYVPYTNIRLYLPFIGIIELSNSDAMRSTISVIYHVDILSGACLADVKITRDGGGGVLYQFAGNAASTLPISSGSYMGVVSSVASVATRALAGFASGGALGAVASGATGVFGAQGTNVQHSGGFSGNAGAMGCKKPYLIIERPQTSIANNTSHLLGYGSNVYTQLNSCKGFTRVKAIHVENMTATENEKNLIETALKNGVVIK